MNDIDDELNVILRQERRQKIAAVNEELNSGFDRQSVTSAPSIKHVDGKSGFEAREKREFQIPANEKNSDDQHSRKSFNLHVSEYFEELSAAEKKKRLSASIKAAQESQKPKFYMETLKASVTGKSAKSSVGNIFQPGLSDATNEFTDSFESNTLVAQAKKRSNASEKQCFLPNEGKNER